MQFADSLLSKEQMKFVKGGEEYGGGSCSTGPCELVVYKDGNYLHYPGHCATTTIAGYNGMSTTICYCNTNYGGVPELSSNGGVSRCTI